MNIRQQLDRILAERILVLDGAVGTMIYAHHLSERDVRGERFAAHSRDLKDNLDVLVLTRPDIVTKIHRQYLAAGADIVETNTFNSNAVSQADYALESCVYELNREGARLARVAADEFTAKDPSRRRFVAGSIGPTNRMLSKATDVNNPAAQDITFDAMRAGYVDQVRGLIDGGVDLLLLETIVDTWNAEAALAAMREVQEARGTDLPLMISLTIAKDGRTLAGQTLDEFYTAIAPAHPWSIGINCAFGPGDMRPYIAELARTAGCWTSAHPSVGLPNPAGEYDETPSQFADQLRDLAQSGFVNILGGCCGTTPEYIARLAERVERIPPRRLSDPSSTDRVHTIRAAGSPAPTESNGMLTTNQRHLSLLSLADARANGLKTDWDTLQIPVPWFIGRRVAEPPLEQLVPYIDWTPFFAAWELAGKFPAILDHAEHGARARELYRRAEAVLRRMLDEKRLVARGVYGFWPANAKGDDIVVYKDDARQKELGRFHMLRQQEPMDDARPNRSLADFIAPRESMAPDYLGAFAVAVTARSGVDDLAHEYERAHNREGATIAARIADRLADAFAEYLHAQARKDWGYAADGRLSLDDLIGRKYRGIRAAFGSTTNPDLTERTTLFTLLDAPAVGIGLTESFAMTPAAAVSGLYFSHPEAKGFSVGPVGRDQIEDYAARKGVTSEHVERWLARNLPD